MDLREQVHLALRESAADQLKDRLETLLNEAPQSGEQHALERFRAYFEQSDDLVMILEDDFTVSYLNASAREALQVRQAGRLKDIAGADAVRTVESYAGKCRDSGERVFAVHKLPTREGTRLFDSVFVPVLDGAGHVSAVVLVAHRVNQRVTDRYARAPAPPSVVGTDAYTEELRALHDLLSMPTHDMREMYRQYLEAGLRFLSSETGFLSRIQGRAYAVLYSAGETQGIGAGSRFLLEDTYCGVVMETQRTVVAANVALERTLAQRKGHCGLQPGAYISAPIWVDGKLFGTLSFFSGAARAEAFSPRDIETIEIMAGGIGRAITTHRERRETDRFFRVVPDLMGLLDLDGTLLRYNHAWTRLLGYEPEDLFEMPCLDLVHPSDREEARAAFSRMLETAEKTISFDCRMQTAEGSYRWMRWHAASSEQENSIAVMIRDQSERRRLENELQAALSDLEEARQELEKLASADSLTGIANERRFHSFYQQEWNRASRYGTPMSLALFEVDDFAAYNETHGHEQGDEVLRQIALELSHGVVRPGDLVARIGPEKFGMVLADTDEDGALFVAEQMMERVRGLAIRHGQSTTGEIVTVSVGVASVQPFSGVSRDTLIEEAHGALANAQEQGKNCCVGVVHTSVVLPPDENGDPRQPGHKRPRTSTLQ